MIRFIVRLLMLSLLTLNISWAADACALTDVVNTSHTAMAHGADDSTPADPANMNLACGHWCHTWVSHLAVLDAQVAASTVHGIGPLVAVAQSYTSLLISPPFHPPIV